MKIKLIFLAILLIVINCFSDILAQNKTYALILGVSDYSNLPERNQLNFADDDALAFYQFLKQKKDIDSTNIEIYLNSQATNPVFVIQRLYQMIKVAKPGDRLIFYFAGHGDTQLAETGENKGFLMLHNVDLVDYSVTDAIDINDIILLFNKGVEKGVKILFITDACRSGSAIASNQSRQRTLKSLQEEWLKVSKLVSCQPNETSAEGKVWGSGHGVFTFYLLNALIGKADADKNSLLEFGEVISYIQENVSKDTKFEQNPKATGNENDVLFSVDINVADVLTKSLTASEKMENLITRQRSLSNLFQKIPPDLTDLFSLFIYGLECKTLLKPVYSKPELKTISLKNVINSNISSEKITQIVFSQNRANCLFLTKSYQLFLTDTLFSKNKLIAEIKEEPTCMAVSDDGFAAFGLKDNVVKIFDINGKQTQKLKFDAAPSEVLFMTENNSLLIGCNDTKLYIYNYKTGNLLKSLPSHKIKTNCITYLPVKRKVLTAGGDKKIFVWNTDNWMAEKELKAHQYAIENIIADKKNTFFVSYSKYGELKIWKTENYQIIKELDFSQAGIKKVDVLDNFILVLTSNNELKTININDETLEFSSLYGPKNSTNFKVNDVEKAIYWSLSPAGIGKTFVNIPKPTVYACDIFEKIKENPQAADFEKQMKGILYVNLLSQAQSVLNPFIEGKSKLPTIFEIKEAERELSYAASLLENDDVLTAKVQINLLLLESYEIILSNDERRYPQAVSKLEEIIRHLPYASYPYNAISLLYQKLEVYAKADSALNVAIKRVPNWTAPHNNLAMNYFMQAKYEKAIGEFVNVTKIDSANSVAYTGIGNVYSASGNFKKADDYYNQSLKVDSADAATYENYSNLLVKRGQYKKAQSMLAKSLENDTTSVNTYLNIAEINKNQFLNGYRDKNYLKIADSCYKQAIAANPGDAVVYEKYAEFYFTVFENKSADANNFISNSLNLESYNETVLQNKTYSKIKELCVKSISLDSRMIQAPLMLFKVSGEIQFNDSLEIRLKKSINTNPALAKPYCNYAEYLFIKGNTANAIDYARTAISKNKNYLPAYLLLEKIYEKNNQLQELATLYTNAIAQFPENPQFYYKKACLGDEIDVKSLEKSQAIDKDFYYSNMVLNNVKFINNQLGSYEKFDAQFGFERVCGAGKKLIIVKKNKKFGAMDLKGTILIPLEFDTLFFSKNNLLCFIKKEESYYMNHQYYVKISWFDYTAKPFKSERYDRLSYIDDGYLKVKDGFNWGIVNIDSEIVTPLLFSEILYYGDGLLRVKNEKVAGFVNMYEKLSLNNYGVYMPRIYDITNTGDLKLIPEKVFY